MAKKFVIEEISEKENSKLRAICIRAGIRFASVQVQGTGKLRKAKFDFIVYGISEKEFKQLENE